MKKFWFILLILNSINGLQAQPVNSDSLRLALRRAPDDTSKIKRLILASLFLPYTEADTALHYGNIIIASSKKIDFTYGIAWGYSITGEAYLYMGDYAKAMVYNSQALRIFETLGDKTRAWAANNQLGEIYTGIGDYKKSLVYRLRGKGIIVSAGDSLYNRLYEVFEPADSLLAYHDYNIAEAYLNLQMADSALKYGKRVSIAQNGWSGTAVLMGDIYSLKRDYTTALMNYNRKTFENYPVDSAKNFIGKANVYRLINRPDSCSRFALQALAISQRMKYAKGVLQSTEILSSLYEETDPSKALRYSKISNAVKDSLYNKAKINQVNSIAFNNELQKLDIMAAEKATRDRYKILSLFGIMFTLIVTGILLWRNNQLKKSANIRLQKEKQTVEETLEKLKSTQSQLVLREKMASLGELTAGIAHEIQNPLNFVNNFSEVNKELLVEMKDEIDNGNLKEVKVIAKDVMDNEEKIIFHGKRAEAIVKGMLMHSRTNSGKKESTDINVLSDEYLRLGYHGLRAKEKSFNVTIKTDFDDSIANINIIPQDIGRVILNLITNALYAVMEKEKQLEDGYKPTVTVSTRKVNSTVEIKVRDNGNGIPKKVLDKIFQPFFTTKPTGQGTGLGLSMSYDIISKGHGGEIRVETEEGKYTTFTIILPTNN
jgi:two-component system NtrC family sensor kinase